MKLRIRNNARDWQLTMTPEQLGTIMMILNTVGDDLPIRAEESVIAAKNLYRDICAAMDTVEREGS